MGLDGELLKYAECQSYRIYKLVARVPGDLYAYQSIRSTGTTKLTLQLLSNLLVPSLLESVTYTIGV